VSLTICNHHSFTPGHEIYVAYMRLDRTSCGSGDGFNAIGWFRIEPGTCQTVYNGDVNYNRYWAYYAEAPDGTTWTGNLQSWVSNSSFRLCHGSACSPCRIVGFRQLDVNGAANYTLTLTV